MDSIAGYTGGFYSMSNATVKHKLEQQLQEHAQVAASAGSELDDDYLLALALAEEEVQHFASHRGIKIPATPSVRSAPTVKTPYKKAATAQPSTATSKSKLIPKTITTHTEVKPSEKVKPVEGTVAKEGNKPIPDVKAAPVAPKPSRISPPATEAKVGVQVSPGIAKKQVIEAKTVLEAEPNTAVKPAAQVKALTQAKTATPEKSAAEPKPAAAAKQAVEIQAAGKTDTTIAVKPARSGPAKDRLQTPAAEPKSAPAPNSLSDGKKLSVKTEPPKVRKTADCVACADAFPVSKLHKLSCKCRYCKDCLTEVFRTAMGDEQFYPPRCHKQEIPIDGVSHFLNERVAKEFAEKKPELDDQQRLYCHVQTCSKYISHSARTGGVGGCLTCDAITCVACKKSSHDGTCPDDPELAEIEALAREKGWRRCPECRRMVELRLGCNHMTCICKTEFCYVCGQHPYRKRTCTCPQFDLIGLRERAQEIVAREGGGDLNEVMELIRQNHQCERHTWERQNGEFRCDGCDFTLRQFIMRCTYCRMQRCYRCSRNR